jgi:hypothetical protein
MNLGLGSAVLAATLLLAGCGDATSSGSGADETTTSPSPTVSSTTATPGPSESSPTEDGPKGQPGVLNMEGLAQGEPPRVPYLAADPDSDAWSLVEPDGTRRALERRYDAFATIGEGAVATASVDDVSVSVVLDADLHEISRAENPSGTIAVTPEGLIAGWLGAEGRPHVVEDGGAQEFDLPQVQGAGSLAALISDGPTCQEGHGGNGCAAFVNSEDASKAWSAVSHGLVDRVPGVIAVGDVTTDGAMVAMTSIADEGSCWGRFQVWKRKPAWETCDYTLFDFSPSGERILAGPPYLDGFGQGMAAVLDDDGEEVASWHSAGQAALLDTVWEDDDHVLAMVWQDDAWAVLRLGLDGSVELAVPPVDDRDGQTPFVLPTR